MNAENTIFLAALENGEEFYFSDWKSNIVPKICAGVYTIWQDRRLIYVGMSGRSMNAEHIAVHRQTNSKAKGLFTRLNSHASGRRSGDQFCVYVGDRLVLPTLSAEIIKQISAGQVSFDKLIKDYTHKYLSYRFVEVENSIMAFEIEREVRQGTLKAGKPFLNPL